MRAFVRGTAMKRWYPTILITVAVLVLLVPAIVAVAGNINEIFGLSLTIEERAALVVGATLVIGIFLLYVAWHAQGQAMGATLQGTALWLPWAAALASSALYLGSVSGPLATDDIVMWTAMAADRAAQSLLVGSGLAGALWLLYAIVDPDFPTAHRQSPGWHGLLKSSIRGQLMRVSETGADCVDPNAANIRRLVHERLDELDMDLTLPDLKWVTRAGFNVAWSEYHALDEALISVVSKASVIDVAMSDLLRLDGSDMPGHAALQHDLYAALTQLDPGIKPYIVQLVPKDTNAPRPAAAAARAAAVVAAHQSTARNAKAETGDCETEWRARTVIQTVHRSLNTYRGSRWAELGAARWQLMLTTTVAGIVATLVLALALIRGVHPDQLMTGWAFFLVGAAAGLFLRLRLASDETQVTDDYGLEAARVFQTPLLSGMAAIIGVVLLASLAGSSLGDILTPAGEPVPVAVEGSPSPEAASTESESASGEPAASPEATATATPAPVSASVQETNSTLSNAFSLGSYPLGLVIALAFGLTPNLVLQRLGVSASNAKKELLATRPM